MWCMHYRIIYNRDISKVCCIPHTKARNVKGVYTSWRHHDQGTTEAYDVTIQRYLKPHTKIKVNKMRILRCIGSTFYVKLQKCPFTFHTKFWTQTCIPKYEFYEMLKVWRTMISQSCDVLSQWDGQQIVNRNNVDCILSVQLEKFSALLALCAGK